jgi:phytoene dehydrogenase-like protein
MKVTIIGAGLAGLACARRLADNNIPVRLLERSPSAGGRVKSKTINGYRIDLGFQVLLNAYPALQAFPELVALPVLPFPPGARIMLEHRLHTLSDPFRNPADALPSVITPVVSIQDKLLMWQLAAELNRRPLSSLWDEPDQTIFRFLSRRGFSQAAIELFFRPFIGGITLDESLGTSAAVFKFVWSMLSKGLATTPIGGMQSIPDAMSNVLLEKGVAIHLETTVQDLQPTQKGWNLITSTDTYPSDLVVIATDIWSLSALIPQSESPKYRSQRTLWLAVDRAIDCGPSLILNPDRDSPFMTVAPMHAVDKDRAPAGTSLFAVTIRSEHFSDTTDHLVQEFYQAMQRNKLISVLDKITCISDQTIEKAQFVQHPQHFRMHSQLAKLPEGIYICGEHLQTSSINGALESGITIADEIVRTLSERE